MIIKKIHIVSQTPIKDKGFCRLTQHVLKNEREDGSFSPEYNCDYVYRVPHNSVGLLPYFLDSKLEYQVILRDCLRPTLVLGGISELGMNIEIVAGCLEEKDLDPVDRVVIEAKEELGIELSKKSVSPCTLR